MKGSITWLGSAALIALAAGCSHRGQQQAETPPPTPPSPTFESNVPPGTPPAPGEAPMPPPAPGTTQGQAPGQEAAPPGAMGQPAPAPTPPSEQPGATGRGLEQPTVSSGESERQLCDTLSTSAKLKVEDVQNGVAIVMTPKHGSDLGSIRDEAHRMDTMLHQQPQGAAGHDTCGLLSIGRLPGVSTSITEGRKDVRVLMTTTNHAEVKDLRRIAREQVNNLGKNR